MYRLYIELLTQNMIIMQFFITAIEYNLSRNYFKKLGSVYKNKN